MFSTLSKYLVVFLTLLQFIAPLVHAHAGEPGSTSGLHVPGLERFNAEHNTPPDQLKMLSYNNAVEGMIVAVDSGVKQSQINQPSDLAPHYYLPQQAFVFNKADSRFDANFSPQSQQLAYCLLMPSPPLRAPPAQ